MLYLKAPTQVLGIVNNNYTGNLGPSKKALTNQTDIAYGLQHIAADLLD